MGAALASGTAGWLLIEPWAAVPAALAGWAARVALAIPRGRRQVRIDPFRVGEPWRQFVQSALKARTRAAQAVASSQDGPLRDRLADVAGRIDRAVDEVWSVAQRGHELVRARRDLGPGAVRRRAERAEPGSETAAALEAQLSSVERLDAVIERAESRLRLLEARLDEAAARTIELAVGADLDAGALGELGAGVDDLVIELEALRQALAETGGTGGTGGGTAHG